MSDPSDQSYEDLLEEHFPYMVRVLSRMGFREIPGWDIDDLHQELRILLWRAKENYDPTGKRKPGTAFRMYLRSSIWNRMNKLRYRELFALRRGAVLTGGTRVTGKHKPEKEARYALPLSLLEQRVLDHTASRSEKQALSMVDGCFADIDLFVDMPEQPRRIAEYVLRRGEFKPKLAMRDLGLTPEELDDGLRILQDRLAG